MGRVSEMVEQHKYVTQCAQVDGGEALLEMDSIMTQQTINIQMVAHDGHLCHFIRCESAGRRERH